MREETRCRHVGYSFRLTARVLLYAPDHRQDSIYHGFCYTSRRSLAGTRTWTYVLNLKCVTWCESITGCQTVQHWFCPPRAVITAVQRHRMEATLF